MICCETNPPVNRFLRHHAMLQRLGSDDKPNLQDLASNLTRLCATSTAILFDILPLSRCKDGINKAQLSERNKFKDTVRARQQRWRNKFLHHPNLERRPNACRRQDNVGGSRILILKYTPRTQKIQKEKNRTNFLTLRRVSPSLLDGIRKLGHDTEGRALQSKVVSNYIKIFAAILECIRRLSKHKLHKPVHGAKMTDSHQARQETTDIKYGDVYSDSDNIRLQLAQLYVSMMRSPNKVIGAHADILEGAKSLLLDRVDTILKLFSFRRANANSSHHPFPRTEGGSNEVSWRSDSSIMKQEAPYIIWILERAVALFREDANISLSSEQQSRVTRAQLATKIGNTPASGSLKRIAGSKLRQTLFQAGCGDDGSSFEDKQKEVPDPQIDLESVIPTIGHVGLEHWFEQEVRRIVGWDLPPQELRCKFATHVIANVRQPLLGNAEDRSDRFQMKIRNDNMMRKTWAQLVPGKES